MNRRHDSGIRYTMNELGLMIPMFINRLDNKAIMKNFVTSALGNSS